MSDTQQSDASASTAQLAELVARLSDQVSGLSEEITSLRNELRRHHPADEVPDQVVLAISAAVAAYLGKRAKVKRVRVRRGHGWAEQARSDIHHSHRAFGSR